MTLIDWLFLKSIGDDWSSMMQDEGDIMKTKYKHIYFEKIKPDKPRKTKVYECRNYNEELLGTVEWYKYWRQYCFTVNSWSARGDIILAKSCLDDIGRFIQQLEAG